MDIAGIPPLRAESLKAQCVSHLERLVISGQLSPGTGLPPEREFSKQLGVSRPVLHEAIVDLAAKGFLVIEPRRGVRVRDFYREGNLATFEAIVLHAEGAFPPGILEDVLGFRSLIELEAVRLAAERRGGEYIDALGILVAEEESLPPLPAVLGTRVSLDTRFHLLLVEASGNRVLPLVVNSLVPVYRSLITRFYEGGPDVALVTGWHRAIAGALRAGDGARALGAMRELLDHGSKVVGAAS